VGRALATPTPIAALALCACLAALLVACGEDGDDAPPVATVYVSAPLHGHGGAAGRSVCARARGEAERAGMVGSTRLRVVCLDGAPGGRPGLAAIGRNARRAAEDSSAIAYVGEPRPFAREFSGPILEEAGIAQLAPGGTPSPLRRVLDALRAAGAVSDLRGSVRDELAAQ
jgi:hypothetical protein